MGKTVKVFHPNTGEMLDCLEGCAGFAPDTNPSIIIITHAMLLKTNGGFSDSD